MRIVMTPAMKAVPAAICSVVPNGAMPSCGVDRMSGFSTRMYAIVKKVTMPPRISRESVEPRSVMWKKRSRTPLGAGAIVEGGWGVLTWCDSGISVRHRWH
jgi:hypothetical protein